MHFRSFKKGKTEMRHVWGTGACLVYVTSMLCISNSFCLSTHPLLQGLH